MLGNYWVNLADRISFAARNPRYALVALLRDILQRDEAALAELTGQTAATIAGVLREPFDDVRLVAHLGDCQRLLRTIPEPGAALWAKKVLLQYAIVRLLRPEIVVETGVANGVSSTYILYGLEKNRKGTLHSVGIPDPSFVPAGQEMGWIVPEWLRGQWKLHIGDSKSLLSPLLQALGEIDVFIHDSLHTYEHMLFEFKEAHPHLRKGGVLIADDVRWNSAFEEFASAVRTERACVVRGVGYLAK